MKSPQAGGFRGAPSLCGRAQKTPAGVGPKRTSPSPAAPLSRTPPRTDGHVRRGRGPAERSVLPEKLVPGGAQENQRHLGLQVELTVQNRKKTLLALRLNSLEDNFIEFGPTATPTFSLIMSYSMVTTRVRRTPPSSALNSSDRTWNPPCVRK